jgi:cyclophilin family peptidyl-prolyl cis-trans isomerase
MAIEENTRLGDLLKYETDKNYCREVVTVASGQNLKLGEIVGMKTANDQVKSVYLITGAQNEVLDGSEIAIGVILEDVDATAGVKKALIVARAAIVADSCVLFPTGATDAQKNKIIQDLDARGIVIRKAV